jgi:hypothetical protein
MNRSTLTKSVASSVVSACLLGGMTDHAMFARAGTLPVKSRIGDFIETADGTRSVFTDRVAGKRLPLAQDCGVAECPIPV